MKSRGLVFEWALSVAVDCVVCGFCLASASGAVLAASGFIAPSANWTRPEELRSTELRSAQEPTERKPSPEVQAGEKENGSEAQKESVKGKAEPERGYAAFYSQSLEGHKTACGGTYSSAQLTAAHPRLPCGTKLRVTNLRNGKVVRVTVNDHGPARGGSGEDGGRVVDLSYAAAQALGFVKQGTTLVKVEVVR